MKKPKFTEEDYNQALDYAYVLGATYCTMLDKCKVFKKKELLPAYKAVVKATLDLYNAVGNECVKVKKNSNG